MAKSKKRYYWLKLKEDFFSTREIKKLRKIAGGDTYTIIYLKMQLFSLKNSGKLYFEGYEDTFAEELAFDIDEDPTNVEVVLNFLKRYELIQEGSDSDFTLVDTVNNLYSLAESSLRSRKCRSNKSEMLQCNTNATKLQQNCNTDIDIDKDIDIELDKDIELDIEQQYRYRGNCYENKIIDVVGCTPKEASVIFNVAKKQFPDKDVVVVVKEKFDIVKKLKYENLVGALIAAIKEDWQPSIYKNSSKVSSKNGFNNFKARDYDYEKLERQLLGWETDEGGD
ncbi:MAG: phage replisome organizer N-terminal domain-containing protein [Clostridium sp.]|nr:phage replisome organizer N-terminal domain-containing protein [Clostridium sp.]